MARNTRRSHGMKKIEPAVETIWFNVRTEPNSATQSYIDISQVVSLVNRRFYRQGLNWAVEGIDLLSNTPGNSSVSLNGQASLYKMPCTWVFSNAWEKGFRSWQKMNSESMEGSESVKPKFLDFKIYADAAHHDAGFGANLLPFGNWNAGEWVASKFVVPAGGTLNVSSREVLGVGANYPGNSTATGLNAVSLIEGYAASRALPDVVDPNVPDDAASTDGTVPENWMTALFNEGTEQSDEVLEDMISENNLAPYPFENDGVNVDTMYPNGANQGDGMHWHDNAFLTGTTVGGESYFHGGMFPCGLLRIDIQNFNTGPDDQLSTTIGLRLVRGTHRGYLAEPMTEM